MSKKISAIALIICFVFGIEVLWAAPPQPQMSKQPQPKFLSDLAISDMWLDNDSCLCAKFINNGDASIINKDVKGEVWVDGKFFLYFLLYKFSLHKGQTYIWKGDSPFKITGPHAVKMIIDSNNQIAESNESNNTMNKSFNRIVKPKIIQKPDLMVIKFKYEGNDVTHPPGVPVDVRQGSTKSIEIAIENWTIGGEVDIVGDFSVGLYLSTQALAGCKTTPYKIWSTTISGTIKAGQVLEFSPMVTIPSTIPPGVYYMYPMVDDTDKIAERNEKANCYNQLAINIIGP